MITRRHLLSSVLIGPLAGFATAPPAQNKRRGIRQVVLDTETTGPDVERGHRIIEIGAVELLNRRITGRQFHCYLNPDRDIEASAFAVHGLTRVRLAHEPRFADMAAELLRFVGCSDLIIHNAPFDLAFLEREFGLLDPPHLVPLRTVHRVIDTLMLARERYPGERNNLDALCRRYGIDHSHRELPGPLLDARLLADAYLALTDDSISRNL
jgi:DNA polymerase-3 subunit epsilon